VVPSAEPPAGLLSAKFRKLNAERHESPEVQRRRSSRAPVATSQCVSTPAGRGEEASTLNGFWWKTGGLAALAVAAEEHRSSRTVETCGGKRNGFGFNSNSPFVCPEPVWTNGSSHYHVSKF
jgi:hypothetical protein